MLDLALTVCSLGLGCPLLGGGYCYLRWQDERAATIRNDLKPGSPEDERDWDVLVTTYEVANIEKTSLNKIGWRYLIIDEAHRCD